MKTCKKFIRLVRLVLLIFIAGIGIGLAGGVPLQITHKKEPEEHAIELALSDEEESESEQIEILQ